MDDRIRTRRTGHARGKLRRLEQDLVLAERHLGDAARRRLIASAMLVIGVVALVAFFVTDSAFSASIAAAGLGIGGFMLVKSLMNTKKMRHSVHELTGGVSHAQADLAELETEPGGAA